MILEGEKSKTYIPKEEINICRRNYVNNKIVNKSEINTYVNEHVKANKCLTFVSYWGATSKEDLDDSDRKTLKNLKEYINWVSCTCKNQCQWIFLLSDVHAQKNGYQDVKIKRYLSSIEKYIHDIPNTTCIYLKEFWQEHQVESRIARKMEYVKKEWDHIEIAETLVKQAGKNDVSARTQQESAIYYYCMRLVESQVLTKKFSDAVFVTYSTDYMKELYPALPCCYLWSERRGISKPPWLL